MMDLLFAALVMVLPPRGDLPVQPLPLVIAPGNLSDLHTQPYVLDRVEWGAH